MQGIDSLVEQFMTQFEIPGVGVALVQPGKPPMVQGYGVRRLDEAERIDGQTLVAVASNSKAFLAACLAILVDERKLRWDDAVVDHLPGFQMYDPAVTRMMTVRDLLVHRSGLPLGAGDLMLFPRSNHTAEDVLRALRFLKPATGFRSGYAYDNVLYLVAGMVLERVCGRSWSQVVKERIFDPLGMADAVGDPTLAAGGNRAGRHARLGPPVRGFGPLEVIVPDESEIVGPAGGIHASLAGMVPWLEVQLRRGKLPDGRALWSPKQAEEMWTPRTITLAGPGPDADAPERPVMQGYALGWGVNDYRGCRMVTHGGGTAGQVSRTALLPERGIGLFLCFNTEDSDALSALRYAILDQVLEAPPFPWLARTRQKLAKSRDEALALVTDAVSRTPPRASTHSPDRYAGRYRDPWYGDLVVTQSEQALEIAMLPTPVFHSTLEPYGVDSFRTHFARGCEDAVVSFRMHDGWATGVTMRALSPIADFSFDFQHLDFTRVE